MSAIGGKADIIGPEGQCLLLTQSGHQGCTAVDRSRGHKSLLGKVTRKMAP
jgi:hypothetical protein